MDGIDITTLFGFGESSGQVKLIPLFIIFLLLSVLMVICSRFLQLRSLKTKKIFAPVTFIYENQQFDGFVLSMGTSYCKLLTRFPLALSGEIDIDLGSLESFSSTVRHVRFRVKGPSTKLKQHESSYSTNLLLDLNQNSVEVQEGILSILKNEYS